MRNGLIIDKYGIRRYYINDLLHRVDGPAEEWIDGTKFWYLHGKKHREYGPAQEFTNGEKSWYLHGERHRVDGPAIEDKYGSNIWFLYNEQLNYPNEFETMKEWIEKLNTDEEYSLHWINAINNLIEVINNPTHKQIRLNAIRWKI